MPIKRFTKKLSSAHIRVNKRLKRNKNHNRMPLTIDNKKVKTSSNVCPLKNNDTKLSQQPVSEYSDDDQCVDKQEEEDVADFDQQVYIYVVRGWDSNTLLRAWSYVSVNEENNEAFLSRIKTLRTMDLTEYGKVLYSGWGLDPPLDVVRNVSIEQELPFFRKGLRSLGFNCTSIKKIDFSES